MLSRFRWPLLLLAVCLPLVLLAAGFRLPWHTGAVLVPADVPPGDCELAWFNTTTGGATWERFIAGAQRLETLRPGLHIDDSNAFPSSPTVIPEIAIRKDGSAKSVLVRWYKLSNETNIDHWLDRLAARSPAPLAIFGGSSSDRAREFALALAARNNWQGSRPIFCITNATAIDVGAAEDAGTPVPLLSLYSGRSFRFCFNNRQMATGMLEFVLQHPELKPGPIESPATAASSVFSMAWKDDPYSEDMVDQFGEALTRLNITARHDRSQIPFSVGGFTTPNPVEAEAVERMLHELRPLRSQRSLLMIPTVTSPARRVLMRLCEDDAKLGQRLVAINGDGMGVNAVLRDGSFNWPLASIPVPLVLFAHNNPAAWDATLPEPNSTDDVLHNAEMLRQVAGAVFDSWAAGTPCDADTLANALKSQSPRYFDDAGNRSGRTGEFVLVIRPAVGEGQHFFEVWTRTKQALWSRVVRRPLPLTGAR